MKINELVNTDVMRMCHSHERHIYQRYNGKECVIAYHKNYFGNVFIIKGKSKYFGLMSLKGNVAGYPYGLVRMDLPKCYRLLQDSGDLIIVNKDEYDLLEKGLLIGSIKEDG